MAVYGDESTGEDLADLVGEWAALGQPDVGDLTVSVAYDQAERHAWRTEQRGDGTIFFDWQS